jgi:secreted PhoX family phosphatase
MHPTSAQPIVAMGRFAHEASALDPSTGYWYLTEDQGNANTLYRFLPSRPDGGIGSLHAGGRLQGLKVRGVMNADLRYPTLCQEFDCEWVDIADPDLDGAPLAVAVPGVAATVAASGPYIQAYANGAAVFGANEGCWVSGGVVFFTDKQVSTALPGPRAGRIWALDLGTMTLKAIFVSNDIQVGNSPDNVCVSPRGGVLFCEDGGNSGPNSGSPVAVQRLMGVTAAGRSYVFAGHNFNFTAAQLEGAGKSPSLAGDRRNSEWAGAVFSPDGRVLFVNLYTPGITLAIWGPWERGTL